MKTFKCLVGAFAAANIGIAIPTFIVQNFPPNFITLPLLITVPAGCLCAFAFLMTNATE